MATAIKKQILHIATIDKISDIVNSVNKLDRQILAIVALAWLSITDLLDQETDLNKFYMWAGQEGGQAGLDKMVPDHIFELQNLKLKTELEQRASFISSTIDRNTQKIITRTIEEGLKSGMNAQQLVQYIRHEAEQIAKDRAEVISETELAYAMGLVESEVFNRNGIKMHRWVTAEDERVCIEQCVANENAGYIEIGDEFPSGVTTVPAHPSCRCFVIPKLPLVITGQIWAGN